LKGDILVADGFRPILAVDASAPLVRVNDNLSRLTGDMEDMDVMLACR
jgi:hypothetical protein